MAEHGLTVVIPVYNERDAIEESIDHWREIVDSSDICMEIIYVNDGCSDGTEKILGDLSSEPFSVVGYVENRGYGAAIKRGIQSAKYDFIAITDADATYPDELIPGFYKRAKEQGLDMLVGARTAIGVQIPLIRKPAKWVLSRLASYLADSNIPDLNSGMRVMRKSTLEKFLNILPNGFSLTTTITLAMLTNNYEVVYESISYKQRKGTSKIRPIRDTLNFVQLICRTVMYFNPLRIFVPLSLLFVTAGIAVLVLSWLYTDKIMDMTCAVFMMTGVLIMAIGLLADLIDKRLQP
ncbi:MAG: glycosyltransferase family 2 protein [Kiritimatiellae bacterium]|nr:glycosyltransferase family 2 protein [Kiritimatiellia bacterium]